MAMFFTSDWHAGEEPAPNTHSFLRPKPTKELIQDWIEECHKKLKPEDELYFLGDMAVSLDDLAVYQQLPACHKIIILGDKEYNNKAFTLKQWFEKVNELDVFPGAINKPQGCFIEIGGQRWFLSHKPTDCIENRFKAPAICGHVHGIWRTQCMPNGQPIINVGIDAWGGLVSEEFIQHQYNAIVKGYYDENARVDLWTKK